MSPHVVSSHFTGSPGRGGKSRTYYVFKIGNGVRDDIASAGPAAETGFLKGIEFKPAVQSLFGAYRIHCTSKPLLHDETRWQGRTE